MEIRISKQSGKAVLLCKRNNGTTTSSVLGPDFPHHDMAHFVVETHFKLTEGFFGHIRNGMTIDELSDRDVIRTLSHEIWLSEILSRNLQSLSSGACTIAQYQELVSWELRTMDGLHPPEMTTSDVMQMHDALHRLNAQWSDLKENDKLILYFDIDNTMHTQPKF